LEERAMKYRITTHEIEPKLILSIRERQPMDDFSAYVGRSFGALFGHLELFGVEPAGMPMVIYHDFGPDGVDAEVCLPIAHELPISGYFQARVLPAATVAKTLHVGPYDDLGEAYDAIMAWIPKHAFDVAGPIQERYLNSPDEVPPAEYRTQIEVPIVPVAVALPV
jgi:effector-binding domain-containing protein